MYGFRRLTIGMDRSAYYHEYFLKHKSFLCENIRRTSVKGNGVKGKPNPKTEPNFYKMPFVTPDPDPNMRNDNGVSAPVKKDVSFQEDLRGGYCPTKNNNTVPCRDDPALEWEALETLDLGFDLPFFA